MVLICKTPNPNIRQEIHTSTKNVVKFKAGESFCKKPNDVVSVSQKVTVTVLEVDLNRKRISLSLLVMPVKLAS